MLETMILGIPLKYILIWACAGILTFWSAVFSDWYDGADTSVGEILGATFVGCIIGFVGVLLFFPYIFKALGRLVRPFNFKIEGRRKNR
jgi:hypothetical protein